MPLVEIDVMGMMIEDGDHARALADELGAHFGSAPGEMRVLLRICPLESCAMNGTGAPTGGTAMVTLTMYERPEKIERGAQAMTISDMVSRELGMPKENVILRFAKGKGRIAYGGAMELRQEER